MLQACRDELLMMQTSTSTWDLAMSILLVPLHEVPEQDDSSTFEPDAYRASFHPHPEKDYLAAGTVPPGAASHNAQTCCLLVRETHCRGALVQNCICGVVVEQPRHRQTLLLSTAQCLRPVLYRIPPLAPV